MGRPRIVKYVARNFDTSQGKLGERGKTDYASTYVRHKNYYVERPGPEPARISAKSYPVMNLQTTSMRTFVSHGFRPRREMIRPQETELATGKFNKDTEYSHEFKKKSPEPVNIAKAADDHEIEPKRRGKFSDKTTNKETFKDYGNYKAAGRYGELPSFTHSLIFPDKENIKELLHSRTELDFPYKTGKKPELIKGAEPNIKVGEGNHDLQTTQRECFKYVTSLPKIHSKGAMKESKKKVSLPKMELTTKYSADFQRRENAKPRKPIAPAPDTLEIKMDNRSRVTTEQRENFHGWDVAKHKRPDPAKIPDNTERSNAPMCVETTMQHDFIPKFQEVVRASPATKPTDRYQPNTAKFRDMTTNKKFFQDWGAVRRPRHGDFHEAYNDSHNLTKIGAPEPLPVSTTHEVFIEKFGRPRTCLKPDYGTIDTSTLHDFNTVNRMTYLIPPPSAYEPEDFVVKC